ncbi:leucyl aminopeptidase [Aquibaculum sediminis]|uniref:leucyl aminopeptidase n=1 Tax=Aquibaculum sediminis TaxID=3231907 RepID=UPI00345486AA
MRISFAAPELPTDGSLAVLVPENGKPVGMLAQLDTAMNGALARLLEGSRFKGKKGQLTELQAPRGLKLDRLVLVGVGKADKASALEFEAAGGTLAAHLNGAGVSDAMLLVDIAGSELSAAEQAAHTAYGALLRNYRFDKYRTKEEKEKKLSLSALEVRCAEQEAAQQAFAALEPVAGGVFTTRNLVSEPANVLYPESFVERAKELEALGVKVEILDEAAMQERGMGALLGVGQGSERESRIVLMTWNGAGEGGDSYPVAFVGKGVCFDTGGISLKPAAGMEDMKWDMGGAGVVVGLMHALAARKAKVNVVGACGLVENMPDGKAQRPGDVVTSMSGQTIEIINTDAEGRLVLADVLTYVQERYKPETIVDLATLTGAIMVALGKSTAGLFSNDDALSAALTEAGKAVGEPVWRLPMGEEYDRMIDSDIADMKNTGQRWGGSITAAQFLQRFVNEGVHWAHIDIAGTTWSDKDKPTVPKGATAFGVRLLDRYVANRLEK